MQDASLIQGLLDKRDELRRDRVDLGERLAIVANDIEAVERILYSCGYQGDLSDPEAKPARFRIFHRGELRSYLLKALREADRPVTARELACRICHADNLESQDRRLVSQVTARIGENLRKMKQAGIVTSERASRGRIDLWRMATDLSGAATTFLCAPPSRLPPSGF